MAIGQAMYASQQQPEAGAGGADQPGQQQKPGGDNVVDAEFTDSSPDSK